MVTAGRPIERVLTYAVLFMLAILAVFPLAGLVTASVGTTGFRLPEDPTLRYYRFALTDGNMLAYLRNSFVVTLAVVPVTVALSVVAGYAFGTMRFRGHRSLFYLFLMGVIVPVEGTLIPLYYGMASVGVVDSYLSVILPQIGLMLGFGTFWMRSFFLAAPRELIEAARMDGATSLVVLWRVLLPVARPAVMTMAALSFLWSWNDFILPLVMISSDAIRTAPLGLGLYRGQYLTDIPGMAAAAILVALPVVLAFVLLQRHFIRGLMSGSVKG